MTGDYGIHLEPLCSTSELIDVHEVAEAADHPWYNNTMVRVGDVLVRLGVFQPGEFHSHRHEDQDEFFMVIDGVIRIELEARDPVELDRSRRSASPQECCTDPSPQRSAPF